MISNLKDKQSIFLGGDDRIADLGGTLLNCVY